MAGRTGGRVLGAGAFALTIVLGTIGAACEPEATVRPVPEAGTVDIAGNSLTEQAYGYLGGWVGAPEGLDIQKVAGSGWAAPEAQAAISANVRSGRPEILVVALGENEAHPDSGGWTNADERSFVQLMASPNRATCVVVVLPGSGVGILPGWGPEIAEARDYMLYAASQSTARTVVVDWQAVIDSRPELIAPDGIHLAGNEAATARQELYWQGVRACQAPATPPSSAAMTPGA
jgi:hypothetical protein